MEKLKQAKAQCLADLKAALPNYARRLDSVDHRLLLYVEDAISDGASHANLYELLGIRKELRLMDSYELSPERVQTVIRTIEGQWNGGRHVTGGLEFDTPRGNMHVRLMPYQVWCLFGIYGFMVDVDMERNYSEDEPLLPSEFVVDGRVWDKRRLTTEAHIFQTRKSGKTEFGAAIDFTETCFLGPLNAQTLICSNSKEQSDIAMKAIKEFAYQLDPKCVNRLGGKYFSVTGSKVKWKPGNKRKGEIRALTAGGKASRKKDGLFASIVHADEHGSAVYINGASDMQGLVEVCWGSTGPRREKLLLHTTTAGLVSEGPYKNQLSQVEKILLTELDLPLGTPCRTYDDKWFAFLLQLDPWEQDYELDQLNDKNLFRKVNRSIGTTVQPTYYQERLHDAKMNDDTRKEVLTKDFNIWQRDRTLDWIKGERIRPLQLEDRRITDCKFSEGWNVFVGCDFSLGDDLFAISYLGVDYKQSDTMAGRFFADTMVWVLEETLNKSPNQPLFEMWISQGWMSVCPGEAFNPDYAIHELMSKTQQGINLCMFGYDPAQSKQPINTLKAWLQTLGIDANTIEQMVTPIPQTALNFNPVICDLEDWIKAPEPWINFSASPLWPWCFGNARIELSRNDLRRVVKATASEKIDPVHALLDAMACFSLSEGKIK